VSGKRGLFTSSFSEIAARQDCECIASYCYTALDEYRQTWTRQQGLTEGRAGA
jgi:hypothetical protein